MWGLALLAIPQVCQPKQCSSYLEHCVPVAEGRQARPTTDQHSMSDWTRGKNICYKMDEPQNTYAKPKKPDTNKKSHILPLYL